MKKRISYAIGVFLFLNLILVSCSEDSSENCQKVLDESRFAEVVKDKSCDTYERGSAYLGLAGFGFSSFLKEDASDNFSETLGLDAYTEENENLDDWKDPDVGVLQYYEKALCLVGPTAFVESLVADGKCDESGARDLTVARPRRDLEISFFGLLGELIVRTFGELDANRDGDVDEDEQNGFSGVDATSLSGDTSASKITPVSDVVQIIANGEAFLLKTGTYNTPDYSQITFVTNAFGIPVLDSEGRPQYAAPVTSVTNRNGEIVYIAPALLGSAGNVFSLFSQIPAPDLSTVPVKTSGGRTLTETSFRCIDNGTNYTGIIDSDFDAKAKFFLCPLLDPTTITDIVPLIKIDGITDIFASGVDVTIPLDFLNIYATRALALGDDLSELGFGEDSDFRTAMNETVEKMDNGGECDTALANVFRLIGGIADNAALSTDTDISTKNLLSIASVALLDPNVSITSIDCPITDCDATVSSGRFVYKTASGSYTDYYDLADEANITSALNMVRTLLQTADPNSDEPEKGNRIITFSELLCLDQESDE